MDGRWIGGTAHENLTCLAAAMKPFMRVIHGIAIAVLCSFGSASGAAERPVPAREQVIAASWMRHSLEYQFLAAQVFRQATNALPAALTQAGTASVEQQAMTGFMSLPPAVILDIDETAIDNLDFSSALTASGRYFNPDLWSAWMQNDQNGRVIPGVVAFVQEARSQGARVVFITNRACAPDGAPVCLEKESTMKALARIGIPDLEPGNVMFAGGADNVPSDKRGRREEVARTHRIVMLVGDDLQDFVPQDMAVRMRRNRSIEPGHFGVRWFLLPNPLYGSWERFISDACNKDGTIPAAAMECHYKALESAAP